jgi:hypothetical protein
LIKVTKLSKLIKGCAETARLLESNRNATPHGCAAAECGPHDL